MPQNNHILSSLIRSKAKELGFEACGIARADHLQEYQPRLHNWLSKGNQASMGYMERNFDKRLDPRLLVEGAASLIVLAQNYFPSRQQHPLAHYKVSKYAYGMDYHGLIKNKLHSLLEYIRQNSPRPVQARVFTDSAPVLERAWAQRAGLGFTGRNACLIIPRKGSFFFLSEIIINLPLQYDAPFEKNLCGSCTRCMQACPTGAIKASGEIDARRCISYLTIESKDPIPREFKGRCQNWIFGCDICQDVCPYNRFSKPHDEPGLKPLAYVDWQQQQWEQLAPDEYQAEIRKSGSPIARASFEKLSGNIRFYQKEVEL